MAELKGIATTIPNESILLDTLPLQEAKNSSAVENIITTYDELFRAGVRAVRTLREAAKAKWSAAKAIFEARLPEKQSVVCLRT